MSRTEFMRQLERLLQNIPQAEREEALQYYNDYFDDAGVENEKAVMDALGNPAKVAENIKRDLYGGEAGNTGTVKNPPAKMHDAGQDSSTKNDGKRGFFARMGEKFCELPAWGQALTVIGVVFLAPVAVSILASIISAFVGLLVGWVSLILGFGVTAMMLLAVLCILLVVGIMFMAQMPWGSMALIGAGLICGGLGILFFMLTVAMAGIVTPAIFRGIAKLLSMIFGKKEVAA